MTLRAPSVSLASAALDPESIRRLDRSGPRYTSYPTALEFHEGVDEQAYLSRLALANQGPAGSPLSLYVHIPFCESRCSFCACHFIATPHREVAHTYLGYLLRETDRLAERLPDQRAVAQMHWGGGTPTYLSPAELEELFAGIARHFEFEPGAELAIEIDPRVTTRSHLETLARLGFNRLSMGVQDFTPAVQEAIGRRQTFEETRALLDVARELGFDEGINFDLVYGLPAQDEASFDLSLDRLLELRPERVAMYSFAYVPWVKPHQRRLDTARFPTRETKLTLYRMALERLRAAGYESIGIDHFALPGDELARAARESRLDRNFMGYTVKPSETTLALGVSGIGEVDGAFFQNERKLKAYYAALDAGRLPIQRGYLLDDDDRLRQYVIRELMCKFAVDKVEVGRRFAVDFDTYFAAELARISDVVDGAVRLVTNAPRALRVTDAGRMFVRNLCMVFDRYFEAQRESGKPAFSRTV
ncbi:MAG: oxygen-independent coproporphyrinogen III oxidase [Acidobacteriota bacterium]